MIWYDCYLYDSLYYTYPPSVLVLLTGLVHAQTIVPLDSQTHCRLHIDSLLSDIAELHSIIFNQPNRITYQWFSHVYWTGSWNTLPRCLWLSDSLPMHSSSCGSKGCTLIQPFQSSTLPQCWCSQTYPLWLIGKIHHGSIQL